MITSVGVWYLENDLPIFRGRHPAKDLQSSDLAVTVCDPPDYSDPQPPTLATFWQMIVLHQLLGLWFSQPSGLVFCQTRQMLDLIEAFVRVEDQTSEDGKIGGDAMT